MLSMKMNLKLDDLIKITNIPSECNKIKMKEFEDETKIDFDRLEMQVEKKIILANRSIKWIDEYLKSISQEIAKLPQELKSKMESCYDAAHKSENIEDLKMSCVCKKPRSDRMITCANIQCPTTSFHYKCVGLRKSPDECWWYCPECRMRVCFCNKIVKGPIIICSSPKCSIELFHYACVGLKTEPTLEWYCENCQGNCICKKSIKGGAEMIKCAKTNCPVESWHLKCTKLHRDPRRKWVCPKCRPCSICNEIMIIGDIIACSTCSDGWCHVTCGENDVQSLKMWYCSNCVSTFQS